MAILYGTTAEGESLPVQVNEFGQLVAQGVPGEQGIQGPPGPPGPVGDYTFESVDFVPTVSSSDAGEAQIVWDYRSGKACRWGPILWASFTLRMSSVVVTNARGDINIGGLPESHRFLYYRHFGSRANCAFGAHFRLGGKTLKDGITGIMHADGQTFGLTYTEATAKYDSSFSWGDLDKGDHTPNIEMTWYGWHHSVTPSRRLLDYLMRD